MKQIQKVLCELLDEIDAICQKNDLDYFLSESIALQAYRSHRFETDTDSLVIYMKLSHALKLREILKKNPIENREFDSIFDNPYYPDFSFKYSDKNSTYINLDENIENGTKSHGISIKISILRSTGRGKKRKLLNCLESAWLNSNEKLYSGSTKVIILKNLARILLKFNRKFYMKIMTSLFINVENNSKYSKKLGISYPDNKVKKFPKYLFYFKKYIDFEGRKYSVPTKIETFLEVFYGKLWFDKVLENNNNKLQIIAIPNLPYKDVLNKFKTCNYKLFSANDCIKESYLKNSAKLTNYPINTAWLYVLRTGARFKMWETYMPKKDSLIELYKSQNWDRLREELEEYDSVVRKFAKKDLTVFFDKEIFYIYRDLLLFDGFFKLARKIEKNIPEAHLKKIDLGLSGR